MATESWRVLTPDHIKKEWSRNNSSYAPRTSIRTTSHGEVRYTLETPNVQGMNTGIDKTIYPDRPKETNYERVTNEANRVRAEEEAHLEQLRLDDRAELLQENAYQLSLAQARAGASGVGGRGSVAAYLNQLDEGGRKKLLAFDNDNLDFESETPGVWGKIPYSYYKAS